MASDTSQDARAITSRKTGFLDLPQELRDEIYDLALDHKQQSHWRIGVLSDEGSSCCFEQLPESYKLLRATCRQISIEIHDRFFQTSTIQMYLRRPIAEMSAQDHSVKGLRCATCAMALTQIRDLELEIDLPYRGDVEICIRARRETNVQNYDVCVNMYHSEARDDDNAKDFGQVDCLSAGLESLVQELAESHTDQHQTFTGRLIEKIGRAAIDAEQLFYDDYFEFVRRYKLDQCITDMAKLHIS